jgi:ABC-type sugar transport system substrate-binding protein
MKSFSAPNTEMMLAAYAAARNAGLTNIRLGNIGIFARTEPELRRVYEATGMLEG